MGSPWKALSDDNRRRIISLLKEKDIENMHQMWKNVF